jgi:mRNA interferase MazF
VLTRDAAIEVLTAVTCAPIIRIVRGIRSEVEVGPEEGLPEPSAITCDNVITIPSDLLKRSPLGHLDLAARIELDQALRYALDIQYRRHTGVGDRVESSSERLTSQPTLAQSHAFARCHVNISGR